jgi:hypothetical protein
MGEKVSVNARKAYAKDVKKENDIEADNHDSAGECKEIGKSAICKAPHDRMITGEPDQRHERDRQGERKDDLAQDQCVGCIYSD